MSAETIPPCVSAKRCCTTRTLGIRDEEQNPRRIKKSNPLSQESAVHAWTTEGAGSGGVWWLYRGGGGTKGRRQNKRASLRGDGLRGTASPAQQPRVGAMRRMVEEGHSQGRSPRSSEARAAANRVTVPGLLGGPPSVRKGSGESYPDPSGTEKNERQKNKPIWEGHKHSTETNRTHLRTHKDRGFTNVCSTFHVERVIFLL